MKKYHIKLSESVQKEIDTLSNEEKEQFCKELEKIRRNPYTGEPMWGGYRIKIWNKVLWFIREIKLKIFGDKKRR